MTALLQQEEATSGAAVGALLDRRVRRLLRRLEQRDRRISGMARRIAELEHALAVKDVEIKRLPRDVTRAVQEALCNVRMIPVLGIRSNDKIIEVRDAPKDA